MYCTVDITVFQAPDNLVVVCDQLASLVFDLEAWPQLPVTVYDLAGSEMADYSVFPVANRNLCLPKIAS
jgi:hypothetical protein